MNFRKAQNMISIYHGHNFSRFNFDTKSVSILITSDQNPKKTNFKKSFSTLVSVLSLTVTLPRQNLNVSLALSKNFEHPGKSLVLLCGWFRCIIFVHFLNNFFRKFWEFRKNIFINKLSENGHCKTIFLIFLSGNVYDRQVFGCMRPLIVAKY